MTFQSIFRVRPAAVKHACHDCEAQRALLRSRGTRTWDRYQALCFRCYGRHLAALRRHLPAAGISAPLDALDVKHTKHTAVA